MTALVSGTPAPNFSLNTIDGKPFSLRDALVKGPVVVSFFKVSCPVCQYAFPFLDRAYKKSAGAGISFVGISQNDKKDTAAFIRQYEVTFPVLLDDTKTFAVSNSYGLTNVPSTFWIDQGGEVQLTSVGWSRSDIEEIARKASQVTGRAAGSVFRAEEKIVEFRAG